MFRPVLTVKRSPNGHTTVTQPMNHLEPAPSPPEALNQKQVATLLNVHPNTIRRWLAQGRMPQPLVVGSTYRWPRQSILDWISRQCDH